MTDHVIETRALTKRYDETLIAVDALDLRVRRGEVYGFLGPNGAGKTTTLRMLLGLVRPDAGTATIGGHTYLDLPAPASEVGAVLEATAFHPARSGRGHLRIYCTVNGYPRSRADEVLDLVGLADAGRRAVRGYSLGMRQRLALATALLGDPRVLVLDEPVNGLDPEGIAWMRRLLRDLAAEGRTVLISSHLLSEVQQLVDDVVIINRGRCVRQGPLSGLSHLDGPVVSVRTPDPDRLHAALARAGVDRERITRTGPDRLRVTGMQPDDVGRLAFAEQLPVLWLTAEQSDLEQVFFAATTDTGRQPALTAPTGA
jgi:ABC-2 type transport system ATP-binding protein